jgi:lipid II:glycine glycyltransferase (peptidoglycan interpeptide bridge formation enzyme)
LKIKKFSTFKKCTFNFQLYKVWQQILDATKWDEALCSLPSAHVLQSWAWGEFKSRWGWTAERWLYGDEVSQPRAAIQLLRRGIPKLPMCVLYAPKGPTVADRDGYIASLEFLDRRARQQRAIWLKIDGDALNDLDWMRSQLGARGWVYSKSQVQFRNTLLTDLRHDDETLFARMKPKWRYNIRLAEKRGVSVRVITTFDKDDANVLYDLYSETGKRDGFIIRTREYYIDAWNTMRAVAFIAQRDGEPLGAIIVFTFADRAYYFYGMSRSHGREHMPNHLLQWRAMTWARDRGCSTYDWWGAPELLDESDSMFGVYRFKEGFGAQFAQGIGAWDFAPSRLTHRVYTELMPRAIRLIRKTKTQIDSMS